jgi:hypothetical protein
MDFRGAAGPRHFLWHSRNTGSMRSTPCEEKWLMTVSPADADAPAKLMPGERALGMRMRLRYDAVQVTIFAEPLGYRCGHSWRDRAV